MGNLAMTINYQPDQADIVEYKDDYPCDDYITDSNDYLFPDSDMLFDDNVSALWCEYISLGESL